MVFPESQPFEVMVKGKMEKRFRPRTRKFPEFVNLNFYNLFIQNFKGDPPLPIKKIAKTVYSLYPKVMEIQFVNRNKLKIVTEDLETANHLLMDKRFTDEYRVTVNYDDVETKGVVGIPYDDDDGSAITEQMIFENCKVKHKPEFGYIAHVDEIQILETKRFNKFTKEKTQTPLNRVLLTFSGKTLPSHVILDNILFPVMSYKEPILQCFKCFRYKHSTRSCNKAQAICRRCAKHHTGPDGNASFELCNDEAKCVNCRGNHPSNDKNCPVFRMHKAKSDEKAALSQPKLGMNFALDNFPPLGTRKPIKKRTIDSVHTINKVVVDPSSTPPNPTPLPKKIQNSSTSGIIPPKESSEQTLDGNPASSQNTSEFSEIQTPRNVINENLKPNLEMDVETDIKRARTEYSSDEESDSLPLKQNLNGNQTNPLERN